MAILAINLNISGMIGITPRLGFINCDDDFTTITTENYLRNSVDEGYTFEPTDLLAVTYGTGTTALFNVSMSSGSITLVPNSEFVSGDLNVTGNISATGNIVAGSGNGGFSFIAKSPTANKGRIIYKAADNAANYDVTVTNASFGQGSTISINDPGASTANFILNRNVNGTQTVVGGLVASQTMDVGTSAGTQGTLTIWPSTAAFGSFKIQPINNSGNFTITVANAVYGQTTALTVIDPASANGYFQISKTNSDACANLIPFDITVGQAALAAGGSVVLYASGTGKQYKIRILTLNSNGTNFSGGGGNRLGQVTDGTTVYSVIPAANMQALTNASYGSTALPYPASVAYNTSTVAGANLVFKYSGGTTDYTAGSLVLSGLLERVA